MKTDRQSIHLRRRGGPCANPQALLLTVAMLLVVILGLSMCGTAQTSDSCKSDSQCTSGNSCVPPDTWMCCGMGCGQTRDCAADASCLAGQLCVEFLELPCVAHSNYSMTSSRCMNPCGDDATSLACPAGFTCDASGRCELEVCDPAAGLGYDCPTHTACQPGTAVDLPYAEVTELHHHGCVRDSCSKDSDCDDGTCVSGGCYSGAGTCQGPLP